MLPFQEEMSRLLSDSMSMATDSSRSSVLDRYPLHPDLLSDAEEATVTKTARQIIATAQSIQRVLDRHGDVPVEYSSAVRAQSGALQVALRGDTPTSESIAIITAVADDLEVKNRAALADPTFAFTPVRVTVRTVDGAVEKRGYRVYYVAEARLGIEGEHEPFDKVSDPTTTKELPVGKYYFWVCDPANGRQSQKVKITIGRPYREAQSIDLQIPTPPPPVARP